VPDKVKKLLGDLDSQEFTTREKASMALEKLGPPIEPFLRRFLEQKPSAEVRARVHLLLEGIRPPPGADYALRDVRAVETLERHGSAEARALLEHLARQDPNSRLGRDARAALDRLGRRKGP
jgi:HEAT repeat protein